MLTCASQLGPRDLHKHVLWRAQLMGLLLVFLMGCVASPTPTPTLVPTAFVPSSTPTATITPTPFPSATLPSTWTAVPQPSLQASQTRLPSPTIATTTTPQQGQWPVDGIPSVTLTPTTESSVPAEASRAYAAALRAFERGGLETALEEIDKALLMVPQHSGFLSLRGRIHVALLHPLQGETDLRAALALNPFEALARRTLAELYASYRRWREASLEYQRYLTLDSDDSEGWFALGQIYEKQEYPLAAVEAYSMTITLAPNHAEALARRAELNYSAGHLESAYPDYSALLRLAPTADLFQRRANINLELDAPLLAAADFHQAISLTLPTGSPTYTLVTRMGEAYLAAGAPIQAAAAFSQALGLNPSLELQLLLGESYLAGQNYSAAVTIFSDTLQLANPLDTHSLFLGRGQAYLGLNEFELAQTDFDTAIELAATVEEQTNALTWRSQLYVAMEELSLAIADLTAAYQLVNDPIYLYRRGILYQTAGDVDSAVTDLSTFLEDADPEQVDSALLADAQLRLDSLTP